MNISTIFLYENKVRTQALHHWTQGKKTNIHGPDAHFGIRYV